MSEREQIHELLEHMSDYQVHSILVFMQRISMENEDYIERMLDEAEEEARSTDMRLTNEEVFSSIRRKINAQI